LNQSSGLQLVYRQGDATAFASAAEILPLVQIHGLETGDVGLAAGERRT